MIELRAVNAAVGQFRLTNISFTIESGDCHVIVGPTGAGKTFLLETLIGLRELTGGNILINGNDVAGLPPNERLVSYVPQDTCLFPNLTVLGNIRYGIDIRPRPHGDDAAFIQNLIDFLRIGDLLDRYPQNLSGGEKQRVALVRALAPKPLLLVLDEPFSAIDHSLREEIRRSLKDMLEEFKTTTLVVTHDLDEAFFLGNRLSVLMNGRIVQSGTRDDIYYFPKAMATAGFLGIRNIFTGTILEISDDQVLIDWPEVNRRVQVYCRCSRKRFTGQQRVRFGTRAESVHILRPDKDNCNKPCVLEGVVQRIFVRGKLHTVVLAVTQSPGISIEIDIHDAAARKIGVVVGKPLSVSLEPRSVFILSD